MSPPFEAFDAGWLLLISVAVVAIAFAAVAGVERIEPFDVVPEDDPVEHDAPEGRPSREEIARRAPF